MQTIPDDVVDDDGGVAVVEVVVNRWPPPQVQHAAVASIFVVAPVWSVPHHALSDSRPMSAPFHSPLGAHSPDMALIEQKPPWWNAAHVYPPARQHSAHSVRKTAQHEFVFGTHEAAAQCAVESRHALHAVPPTRVTPRSPVRGRVVDAVSRVRVEHTVLRQLRFVVVGTASGARVQRPDTLAVLVLR